LIILSSEKGEVSKLYVVWRSVSMVMKTVERYETEWRSLSPLALPNRCTSATGNLSKEEWLIDCLKMYDPYQSETLCFLSGSCSLLITQEQIVGATS
jgi:hypothetical protein